MTIEQLKQLIEINKCSSMTQASKNLYISHQALSASIRSLEKEVQTVLVEKTPRGSKLTLKGKQLVEISSDFIEALDDIFFSHIMTPKPVEITVSISYVGLNVSLGNNIASLVRKIPALKPIFLELNDNGAIIDTVLSGRADLGFCVFFSSPENSIDIQKLFGPYEDKLEYRILPNIGIYCEMTPSHPLAYLEKIPLKKLKKYTLKYYHPRILSPDELLQEFPFAKFFTQFDLIIEQNISFYLESLYSLNHIGISIGEANSSFNKLIKIPLQDNYYFSIFALRMRNKNYTPEEEALFQITY